MRMFDGPLGPPILRLQCVRSLEPLHKLSIHIAGRTQDHPVPTATTITAGISGSTPSLVKTPVD
jgi:hypothetical protein